MPDPDFQLTADFYFPSDDCPALDLQEVIALLKNRIPTATIDFERGRQQVEANIERLKALGFTIGARKRVEVVLLAPQAEDESCATCDGH